jgi:hypothetical protein
MSSGWSQDQRELSWPRAPLDDPWPPAGDAGDAEPERRGAGRGDSWAAGQGFGDPWGGRQESRTQLGRTAVPPPRQRQPPEPGRQPPQPDSGFDGDEDYDWYRYLSHGGSPPSRDAVSAGLAASEPAPLADRPGRAQRAARKNRDDRGSREERKNQDKRKTRRDRKARTLDDGPLAAWPPAEGVAGHPAETGPQREVGAPAAFAGPAGDIADTGPGHGWRAYPGSAAALPPDAGYGQSSFPGSVSGQAPPPAAGFGESAYPVPGGTPLRPASPGDWPPAAPDAGRDTQHFPAQGYAPQPSVPQPFAPQPFAPRPSAPGGYASRSDLPRPSAPRGSEQPADSADFGDYGHELAAGPPAFESSAFESPAAPPPAAAAVAQRPAKRGRKSIRPPAARAVRRAAHPDVLERDRLAAAAGTAGAGLAAPPDVAERPVQPEQPVRPERPASLEGPVNPDFLVKPARPPRPAEPDRRDDAERPERAGPVAEPSRTGRSRRAGRVRGGRRLRRRLFWLTAGAIVVVIAAAALRLRPGAGPAHALVTPPRIGAFVQEPHLAKAMDARQLQQEVVTKSAGEAKHVVYAVYEDATGAAAHSGPQIILFIGGNLTGTSPGGFISSFIGEARGAQQTSAGSMGGEAACVSRVPGSVAECAWADNDTFGVVASPTLSVSALAAQLRTVRPQVEHPAR